ncbi:MAG: leucine-rich repeat protein [Treponema sp.]|nr:leucine-rich repeat protein [Treponema sp.]
MSKTKGQALSGAASFFLAAFLAPVFLCAACESPVDNGERAITWTALADGEAGTAASTKIDFTFSGAVMELTADDITVAGDGGSVTKGSVTMTDDTHWSLGITVATEGNVKVRVGKTGIETGEKDVAVYQGGLPSLVVTVTFDKNGGATEPEPRHINLTWPDTTVADLPVPPSGNGGQVFRGWNTAADGSGAEFTAGTEISESITVYARWGAPLGATVTDVADVAEWLSAQSGGARDSPVNLVLNIDLGNMAGGRAGRSPWYALLDALEEAGKYVALDLSDCTMTGAAGDGTVFRPIHAEQEPTTGVLTATYTGGGKAYIVELTLPLCAKKIFGAWAPQYSTEALPAFLGFSNLEKIRGDNIEGAYAETGFRNDAVFIGISSLKEAYFEKLTDSDSFFWKCRNLEYVYCPSLTDIGGGTFYGCTSLKTFDFSNVQSIGARAFGACTSLTELDLGQVTKIQGDTDAKPSIPLAAFNGCSNLETIIFPACFNDIGNYKSYFKPASVLNPLIRGGMPFAACPKIKEVTFLGDPADIAWLESGPPYETGLDDTLITLALSGQTPEERTGTYVKDSDDTWSKKL